MNCVCHYGLVCCAMLWYAMSCCARSLGVSSKEKEKSSNHAAVFGSRAAIVHVGDDGASRGVLRRTEEPSRYERSRHHGCDRYRGPSR